MDGAFYLVSVPIGNMEDITIRAKETLKKVDFIVAEDTREAGKLLKLLEIPHKELISYRDEIHEKVFPLIRNLVDSGKSVAMVSDRGTPTISDPGFKVVRDLYAAGIAVTPIPGVSAVITALSVSGLPTDKFCFLGFLPRTASKQVNIIGELVDKNMTIIFYESPFRVVKTLETLKELIGDKTVSLAHELTKVHESVIRGSVTEVIDYLSRNQIRGEWVVLIR